MKSPAPSRAGTEGTTAAVTGRGFDQDEHGINFPKLCNSFVLAGVGLVIIPGAQNESPCVFCSTSGCACPKREEEARSHATVWSDPRQCSLHTCWQSPAQLWHLPNAAGSTNHFITAGVCMAVPGYSCGQACTSLLWATVCTKKEKKQYNVIFALIWIHEMDFVAFSVVKTGHSCLQINTAILASTSSSPTASVNCTLKSLFSVLKCAF